MENKIKALIVDDEMDICFLLSSILQHKNLDASFVHSIKDAKKILEEDKPSVIFLDNHLPDGYGISFAEEIKQKHPEAKIVMITAHDAKPDRNEAFKNGVDHFIGKPFTRDVVFKTVEHLFI